MTDRREDTILRHPRKGERFSAKRCVLRTTDDLLSYKRGNMKGVSADRAKEWEDALQRVIDEWTEKGNRGNLAEQHLDMCVYKLVEAVVAYAPVKDDDTRGY